MHNKTVAIFGVFDGVHEGHREFITVAKKHGDQLVAIVARDAVVEKLKNKTPKNNEALRIKALLEVSEIDRVYLGDVEEGTYKILREVHPDVVYLGYDQQALHANIKKAIKEGLLPDLELLFGNAHKPEIMHSSILNRKK
jgi:cytidyltransferase-like protein